MSRIRIVEGKITEKIGGNMHYYSETNITEIARETYSEKSAGIISYEGKPDNKPAKEIKNSIKGFAIFRRKSNYKSKPDFGFDWYAGDNYGTTYNEPFNFNDDKILLSGRKKLQKEYSSTVNYFPVGEFGYIKSGKNGQILLNSKNYFVPWFSGFAKDDSGAVKSYELDVFFYIEEPAEGKIYIKSNNESVEVEFTDDNSSSFNINESQTKQFSKGVKITFQDYITEHASIIITFHKKGDDEKAEEKKREADIAAGKKSDSLQTVYITPGQLMGALNVYKNSVEYNVVFRYIKVFFKGWIYIENIKNKIYLSGATLDYKEDMELVKEQRNLTQGIENLRALQVSILSMGNTTRAKEIQDLIYKQEKKLQELKDLSLKRKMISTELYNEQLNVMKNRESFINNNKISLINMFSQPLIRYKEKNNANYEQLEIDVKEMDSFFDDLKLKKSGSSHFIIDDDNEEIDSGRIRNKISKAFEAKEDKNKKEFIVFLLPFGIISDVKNRLILLGKAEDVSYEADSAILTPQADISTFIHEAGHTFNLAHTFLPRDKGWFSEGIKIAQGTTDNIMDYEYNLQNSDKDTSNDVPIIKNKISLWKFQWDIMRKDPNLIESVKK